MFDYYLFSIPIINAFNFSSWFTWPLIFGFLLFMKLLFINNKIFINYPSKILLLFLFFSLISLYFNINNTTYKNLNHEIGLFTVIILYYIVILNYVNYFNFIHILKVLSFSYILSMLFAFFEFICINVYHFDLNNYIPRARVEQYFPTFFGSFIRARSFFEESGHYGGYLAIMMPFVLFYLRKNKTYFCFVILMLLVTSFFIFSSSFFIFVFLGFVFLIIKNLMLFKINKKFVLIIGLIVLFLLIILFIRDSIILDFIKYITLDKINASSGKDRLEKIFIVLSIFKNSDILHILFGYGAGSFHYMGVEASISVYFNFLRDFGVVGLLLFLIFYVYNFYFICKFIKKQYKDLFYFSLLMVLFYYMVIGNYFYPYFWIPFVLMYHKEVLK